MILNNDKDRLKAAITIARKALSERPTIGGLSLYQNALDLISRLDESDLFLVVNRENYWPYIPYFMVNQSDKASIINFASGECEDKG